MDYVAAVPLALIVACYLWCAVLLLREIVRDFWGFIDDPITHAGIALVIIFCVVVAFPFIT